MITLYCCHFQYSASVRDDIYLDNVFTQTSIRFLQVELIQAPDSSLLNTNPPENCHKIPYAHVTYV